MRKYLMFLCLLISIVRLSDAQNNRDSIPSHKNNASHAEWVSECLNDFKKIKIGMNREVVDKMFASPGGISSGWDKVCLHPDCRYFAVQVKFSRARDERGKPGPPSPQDTVIKISAPFFTLNRNID